MTPTCDSAESVATLPPESDLDDEQILNQMASPLYLQEREASADRSSLSFLQRKLCVNFISLPRKFAATCRSVLTKESRVNNHLPTEKVFLWHTEHFEEKTEVASIFQIFLLRVDELLASRAGLAAFFRFRESE